MRNKIAYTFCTLAFILFALSSCHNATQLKAEIDTIQCDRPGLKDSIRIKSDGNWKVTYKPLWINTEKKNDSILNFTIEENRTRRTRVDSIVLEADNLKSVVKIIEMGVAKYVQIDDSVMVFKPQGELRTIKLGTDGCFVHVSCPDFIEFFILRKEIHMSVSQNRTGDREGTIIITVDSLQRQIRYRQEMLPYLKAMRKAQAKSKEQAEEYDKTTVVENQSDFKHEDSQTKEIEVKQKPKSKKLGNCHKCGGTGEIPDEYGIGMLSCDQCNGTGSYQ